MLRTNLIINVAGSLVLLEMPRLNSPCVQFIELFKSNSFRLWIQEPTKNRNNEAETTEDEANFTSQVTGVWVNLEEGLASEDIF